MTLGKTFPIQNHSKMEVIRSQGLGMHGGVREDHKLGGLSQACCIQGLTSFILSFLIWEMRLENIYYVHFGFDDL